MHEHDSTGASLSRRQFLWLAAAAPAVVRDQGARPVITSGVQTGDVEPGRGVVWCRADRPARLRVRYGTTDGLERALTRVSDPVSAASDFTARLDLTGLPAGQRIVYEARFEATGGELSEPVRGSFSTPSGTASGTASRTGPIRIAWGGDVCGQGWGIDEGHGGMKAFASMQAATPDLFIHSGDLIYADGPIAPSVRLADGSTWTNLVSDGVDRVAQTLDEFRGRYRYNLHDPHLRAFNAAVPMVAQWDDHEVLNNWYPTEILGTTGNDARYTEKSVAVLAARAKQAFFDYTPIRRDRRDPRQVYRIVRRGPLADVFVLDCRSYRGPNSPNLQPQPGPETAMFAAAQRSWLEEALARSTATWKIVACDQPVGLVVPDGPIQEGFANGDPRTLGREHEVAALLSAIKRRRVRNVIFVTADVHYAAAHRYDPSRATYTDFDPFWEFVAGPLHAGTASAANPLDATFGPQVAFTSPLATGDPSPNAGLQFFGLVTIDPATRAATVTLHDREGRQIYSNVLPPADA